MNWIITVDVSRIIYFAGATKARALSRLSPGRIRNSSTSFNIFHKSLTFGYACSSARSGATIDSLDPLHVKVSSIPPSIDAANVND